jgi:uncharacterized iron-regulated membrane protein
MARRTDWRGLHSLLALPASLFLFFLFLTGSLAVFSAEIDWLLHPAMRAAPAGEERISWGAVFDAAQAAQPGRAPVAILRAAPGSPFADRVLMLVPGSAPGSGPARRENFLWVDPRSGRVQGETPAFAVEAALRGLHRHLLLPLRLGVPLVSAFALLLAALVLAGALAHPRFLRGFVLRPRFGGRARAWASDLHRLLASWSLPFLLLLCLTGIWYFAESVGLAAPPLPEYRLAKRAALLPAGFDGAALDRLVAAGETAFPGLAVREILLPRRPDQPVELHGEATAVLVRVRANTVHLDPATGAVLGVHRGEELSPHQRLSEAADPLHFGLWGGLPARILWAVSGLVLAGIALLGALVHARRIGARLAAGGGAVPGGLRLWWRGAGAGGRASAALVAGGLGLLGLKLLGVL